MKRKHGWWWHRSQVLSVISGLTGDERGRTAFPGFLVKVVISREKGDRMAVQTAFLDSCLTWEQLRTQGKFIWVSVEIPPPVPFMTRLSLTSRHHKMLIGLFFSWFKRENTIRKQSIDINFFSAWVLERMILESQKAGFHIRFNFH